MKMTNALPNRRKFPTFWPGYTIGVPFTSSWSFANATRLPVNVIPPRRTSKPSAVTLNVPRCSPCRRNSETPTSAAARPPNACESAVRCGIAVIGTQTPSQTPIVEPTRSPTMTHS